MFFQTLILLTICISTIQIEINSSEVPDNEIETDLAGPVERLITTAKYSKFKVTPTIINGSPVTKGQFPYMVSIKEPVKEVGTAKHIWRNLCGGTIIQPEKVLTAAHCFEVRGYYYWTHYDKLRVVAGNLQNEMTHTGQNETTPRGQWRSIRTVTLHKGFQFPVNDIALVFVSSQFAFTGSVDYATVASVMTDYPRSCVAAGYGQTSNRAKANVSTILQWADIPVLSRKQCDVWWEINMDKFVCTNSMAADVSGGDSGGPLICSRTLDPKETRGRDLVVGVTCGKNFDKTTLFTRVAAYRSWIANDGIDGCGLCEASKFVVFLLLIIRFYIRLLSLFIIS